MHKCELTTAECQKWADILAKGVTEEFPGGPYANFWEHLTYALRELAERRLDAESEFRITEASLAYSDASSFLECHCSYAIDEDGITEWLDLASLAPADDSELEHELSGFGIDAVAYLNHRALLDQHPEHPGWIMVRDEDEPRAEGPLDPCPEVK